MPDHFLEIVGDHVEMSLQVPALPPADAAREVNTLHIPITDPIRLGKLLIELGEKLQKKEN